MKNSIALKGLIGLVRTCQLTAGSAKNEMPRMAQNAAMSLPDHVIGTESP